MGAFVVYLLKSSLLLALLVSLFLLFMSRETFHKVNRYIMLSIVALSLVLPFVNVGVETYLGNMFASVESAFETSNHVTFVEGEEEMLSLPVTERGMADMVPGTMPVGELMEFPSAEPVGAISEVGSEASGMCEVITVKEPSVWLLAVVGIYLLGVAVMLVRLLVTYMQVVRVISRGRVVDTTVFASKGVSLRVHEGEQMPFSWFRWVVVSEKDLDVGVREVLIHEAAHARAGHSWDVLFADAVIVLQWFNPIAWIMKNCLKDIHEFEADEVVINSGVNAKQYQLLIIKKAVGARLYSIANSFNHSLTKKRITMMCKEKSKKWSRAKALYILPVAAAAALSFSTVENANAVEAELASKVNENAVNGANDSGEISADTPVMPEITSASDTIVYMVVEQQPEFPGGNAALMKYLSENIKYPDGAMKAGKQGKAFVQFVVKADGAVNDVVIMKSSGDKSLDAEALRVVKSMPKWNPGKQGGKAVNVRHTLPVNFRLADVPETTPVIELQGGAVAVDRNMDAVVVVDGEVYEGDIKNIDSKSIKSITVVKAEQLTEDDIKKYGAEGKQGIIFIETINVETDVLYSFTELEDLNGEKVYPVVEQQPEFPGGLGELMNYLKKNIKYPQKARDFGAQGKVYVRFVVTADGRIERVSVRNEEVTTTFLVATELENLERHIVYYKRHVDENENELENLKRELERMNKEYEILERDGAAPTVLERRKDEIQKLMSGISSIEGALKYWRHELDDVRAHFEKSKSELEEVTVVAYKSGKISDDSIEELYELNKAAIQSLRDESVRVVKSMPKWKPGQQGGKNVNVEMTLPITFRLQ